MVSDRQAAEKNVLQRDRRHWVEVPEEAVAAGAGEPVCVHVHVRVRSVSISILGGGEQCHGEHRHGEEG